MNMVKKMKTWNDGKLENKNTKEIESFLSGKDILLDQKLVKWDILSTIAHEVMLKEIGLLNQEELKKILTKLLQLYDNGIQLKTELEDVHSNIEFKLIQDLGDVGKKVHTAISRNEQIIVDLQLFMKNEIIDISKKILELEETLSKLANKYKKTIMPGYTHHQQAMPYTFGSFLMAHFYSLIDDLEILQFTYSFIDKNSLGSGAGYGIPIKLNKKLTTKLLGFSKINENSLHTINSRGKYESIVVFALSQLMSDLNKLSQDLILFSMKEFNFIDLPEEYCTGSSIMPQKKNPDVLELIKGKTSDVIANLFQNFLCMKNLPSGYNKDIQETKSSLMDSIDIAKECLKMMNGLTSKIKVNENIMKNSLSKEIFATHYALSLTKKGIPYKKAYEIVGEKLKSGKKIPNYTVKPDIGNYSELLKTKKIEIQKKEKEFISMINSLLHIAKSMINSCQGRDENDKTFSK
jgi:argininosuccinate lyase